MTEVDDPTASLHLAMEVADYFGLSAGQSRQIAAESSRVISLLLPLGRWTDLGRNYATGSSSFIWRRSTISCNNSTVNVLVMDPIPKTVSPFVEAQTPNDQTANFSVPCRVFIASLTALCSKPLCILQFWQRRSWRLSQ